MTSTRPAPSDEPITRRGLARALDGEAHGVRMRLVARASSSRSGSRALRARDVERVAKPLIVGAKAEQAAGERLVGAVSFAGARERAVQLDARAARRAAHEPAREQPEAARARRVRRRRADHHGADDVEQRDHRQPAFCARRAARAAAADSGPCATPAICATSSGVPCATIVAAARAALGTEIDDPVRRLDHVEVVLDHEHRVARDRRDGAAPRAACARPRSAGPSSARRGCRTCGPCRASRAPSRASRAAPRRRRASSRSGRGGCSRARRRSSVWSFWRMRGWFSKNAQRVLDGHARARRRCSAPRKRTSSVSRL